MGREGRISCCYGCTERTITCHTNCKKYLAERARVDKENEARNKFYANYDYIIDKYNKIAHKSQRTYDKRGRKMY